MLFRSGMPVGFAGIILGSLLTRAPALQIQAMVDQVRYPRLATDNEVGKV